MTWSKRDYKCGYCAFRDKDKGICQIHETEVSEHKTACKDYEDKCSLVCAKNAQTILLKPTK